MVAIPLLIRVAAVLHWITAVGFGVFCFPAIWNLIKGRDIPIVLGFPAYGRGPFERVGISYDHTATSCVSACVHPRRRCWYLALG